MLEKQMIFAWAQSPNDIEKLFLKLQVCMCLYFRLYLETLTDSAVLIIVSDWTMVGE